MFLFVYGALHLKSDTWNPAAALASAYSGKDLRYFAGAREDMVADLPFDPTASILEIGCGSGDTGALALERGRAKRYVGVELMVEPAATAATRLSRVLVGDAEQLAFDFQPAEFDGLIMSEVLEHLRDPEALLKRLHRFVRPDGVVLASSPNIANWKVLRELLAGRFPQADRGVFDRTHLRWFTPESFAAMFERAGYKVVSVRPVRRFSARQRLISRLFAGRADHLLMTQISIVALRR
ncbi:MAG: class I SAM-dependent methyltransferase [Alphaproteobacteria bacterium]|nr:class I SAM-dependent methyltransferase [Alphaproteobacteria bacterium]